MRIALLVAALSLASVASAQIPIPPFGSTFTSTLTRGFWFQAPANALVAGIAVPNEAAQPFQVIEFIDLGLTPPPAYPATVVGTQLYYSNNTAGGSTVATAIPLISGNYYGVLGACTSTVGSTTSYNSYANVTGAFTSNILGIPTTLTRFGTQFGIGAGGNQPCWSEVAGTISRVQLTIVPIGGGTVATNTTLGAGCVSQFGSFYENFATAAAFDLGNTALTMIPTGTGYVVIANGAFLPVGSVQATPTVLALTDDSEVTQPFTVGTFPGWTGATVCSNGFVSKASGNGTSYVPDVTAFLAGSQDWFSLAWHDYNPAAAGSGQIKFEESSSVISITWDGVYDYAGTTAANANTMQLQLYPSGQVVMAWGTMSTLGGAFLTGFSPGGPNNNPGNSNLSNLGSSPITLAVPEINPLQLAASSRPVAGTNWNLNVTNVPVAGTFGLEVFGLSDPGIPDLGFLGAPGCGIRASLDVLNAWVAAGGAPHPYSLAIPPGTALNGVHVYTNAVVLWPGINTLLGGVITSNGIDGSIGNL